MNPTELLPKVKANLILTHDEDDDLLLRLIAAAVDYAQSYQKRTYEKDKAVPAATEQAVIMLASHFYESRDGGTGGFFAGTSSVSQTVWQAVNRLLVLEKRWEV